MHKSTPFGPSYGFLFVFRVFFLLFSLFSTWSHVQVPNCIIFGEESQSLQQGMEKQQAFEMFDYKAQDFYWDLFPNVNMSS